MKSRTRISWADFTLNPWEGCTKVSDGCRFCYAENRNQRFSNGANWGPGAPRRLSKSAYQDLATIRRHFGPDGGKRLVELSGTGERWIFGEEEPPAGFPQLGQIIKTVKPQIFCCSLADVLDHEVPVEWFGRWIAAAGMSAEAEFLMLTKRPERFVERMAAALDWATNHGTARELESLERVAVGQANHIAWGTTVENEYTRDRVIALAAIPAAVRFLSCEPLLGDPRLGSIFSRLPHGTINLVITGGESGNQARPMHPWWIDQIDQACADAEIPHHFKQWGTWAPATMVPLDANQQNLGNVTQAALDRTGGPFATMHRTPSKLAVKPLFQGTIQQPRLIFPQP